MADCLVLPGIGGLAVQALLAACCLGVFYIKRQKETIKLGDHARTKEEFFLDASKQFAGAAWIHILNLMFASALNGIMSSGDECEWYWINIMVDTTLGTAVAYVLLKVANNFVRKKMPQFAEDFKSGEYRGEDGVISMRKYGKQLAVWLAVISSMKVLMVVFMFLFSVPLLGIAGVILAPFLTQPWLKLLVVMIVFPLIMDAFQIWMIDNFIKKRTANSLGGIEEGPEIVSDAYVEASADALLAFSHRCEEAAEEGLLRLKARCKEALQEDEELSGTRPCVHTDFGNQQSAPHGNFETQYKFQTLVPPDHQEGL